MAGVPGECDRDEVTSGGRSDPIRRFWNSVAEDEGPYDERDRVDAANKAPVPIGGFYLFPRVRGPLVFRLQGTRTVRGFVGAIDPRAGSPTARRKKRSPMTDWPIFILGLVVMSIITPIILAIGRMEARELAARKSAAEQDTPAAHDS